MTPDVVVAIRKGAHLTQEQLAHKLGVTVSAVRHWEQGLRRPSGLAVTMLAVIKRESQKQEASK